MSGKVKKSVSFEVPVGNIPEYEDISEIFANDDKTTRIFIGNEKIAKDFGRLKEMNIPNIIQVRHGSPPKPGDFKYCVVSVSDMPMQGIMSHFERTNAFIDKAIENEENVLVHCTQGVSRSCTIVVAFMIYKFGMSAASALRYVKSKRKICKPNKGFWYQLKEYEKEIKSQKKNVSEET